MYLTLQLMNAVSLVSLVVCQCIHPVFSALLSPTWLLQCKPSKVFLKSSQPFRVLLTTHYSLTHVLCSQVILNCEANSIYDIFAAIRESLCLATELLFLHFTIET